mmetsp:Transcript_8312/g.11441  ORF Transcript_8312/g.11441 Transcript_8312/m.11441 type:complete len:144 (-) Transcript_8312:93-524(-)
MLSKRCSLYSSSSSSSSSSRPIKRTRTEMEHDNNNNNNDTNEPLPPTTSKLSISLHFDGGARGNPGVGGSGAIVVSKTQSLQNNNTQIHTKTTKLRQYCGSYVTNNVAEYTGLLIGLKEIQSCVDEFTFQQQQQQQQQQQRLT